MGQHFTNVGFTAKKKACGIYKKALQREADSIKRKKADENENRSLHLQYNLKDCREYNRNETPSLSGTR